MSTTKQKPLHILVTRPGAKGEALCQRLSASGDLATHFPTIEFAPPKDPAEFMQTLNTLGEMDWLIFLSPQSVISSVPFIRKRWPHFSDKVKFAAIGAGTAHALKDAGYNVDSIPSMEWSSEGLLSMPEFNEISGKKIAIICGEGGRGLLEPIFTERGAHVEHLLSYQRVVPKVSKENYPQIENIDVIICASFDAVKNLKKMLKKNDFSLCQQIPLIVASERIKMLAEDLDFQTIWAAHSASDDAMLEVLLQKRKELCKTSKKKL